jgi:cell division protein FtsI/penicillin-binding protein 2
VFDRGAIFLTEKDGEPVLAASILSGGRIAILPNQISDVEEAYQTLSAYLTLDKEEFVSRASKSDDPYEIVATRVQPDIANLIRDADIDYVRVERDSWRYYPGDSLAAHTIGFVAYDDHDLIGRYGLERSYDDVLRRSEDRLYVNFFAEIFSKIGKTVRGVQSNREADIITTIDPWIQKYLESKLGEVTEAWQAAGAGGIVIDPATGDIVALATTPTFDLNAFNEVKDPSLYGNPLVESAYEMGSIMKPITMAIGLDTGAVTPDSTYEDKGSITLDGSTISNFDGRARGVVPMQQVLSQSLNTGSVEVMQRVGIEQYKKYLRQFGVGEKTGIDLPNETTGLTANLDGNRPIEFATASFGQGIALSPIAMTRALSVLANGGYLVKPRITKEIDYRVGFSDILDAAEPVPVISPDASETITQMLVTVVDEALAGGTVKMEGYSIAAKTGTAQIADPVNGGYYEDRYLHSFFGYFPAYDAKYLVFLYLQEPQDVRYSSETLTTPFFDIVKLLISYYEIPPDR